MRKHMSHPQLVPGGKFITGVCIPVGPVFQWVRPFGKGLWSFRVILCHLPNHWVWLVSLCHHHHFLVWVADCGLALECVW